jgi:galactonate dehydratase
MALLDILGKKAGVPVYQVLGGATRSKIRMLTALEGSGAAQVKAGHRAFIVPVPEIRFPNPRFEFVRSVSERLEALRKSLGENVDFVLDGRGALPPAEAANLAAAAEKFHVLWFDEPCSLDNMSAVGKIAKENVTPLGFGRNISKPGEVQDLFRQQAIDILRLDIRTHGLTQIRRLSALAETYYTAVAPYNDGGPIATAAAIQLAASLPNFFIQQVPASLSADYASGLPAIENGFMPLPTAPGLGLNINETALQRYPEAA